MYTNAHFLGQASQPRPAWTETQPFFRVLASVAMNRALWPLSLLALGQSFIFSVPRPRIFHTTEMSAMARRRDVLGTLGTTWAGSGLVAQAADDAARPRDFTVIPEKKLPFSAHYAENARLLAANLKWVAANTDAEVDANLKKQLTAFNSLYRRDMYTQYGALPGLNNLETAYQAAAGHYTRYGFGHNMSEQLAATITRNVQLAEKALAKVESTKRMSEALEARAG